MVASIDGSTNQDGASAGLSSDADRQVLLTLRSLADMIIVGAGTVRAEGYGPPTKPGQRIGVVSRNGNVDPDIALFATGAGFLIMAEDSPSVPIETIRAGVGDVDLVTAMHALPGNPSFVQAEGGAMLNGALATADLVDEVNITTSPLIIGGDGDRATSGAPRLHRPFRLAHLLEDDHFVFSRYVRS